MRMAVAISEYLLFVNFVNLYFHTLFAAGRATLIQQSSIPVH
jgi:hypothetical protein